MSFTFIMWYVYHVESAPVVRLVSFRFSESMGILYALLPSLSSPKWLIYLITVPCIIALLPTHHRWLYVFSYLAFSLSMHRNSPALPALSIHKIVVCCS